MSEKLGCGYHYCIQKSDKKIFYVWAKIFTLSHINETFIKYVSGFVPFLSGFVPFLSGFVPFLSGFVPFLSGFDGFF